MAYNADEMDTNGDYESITESEDQNVVARKKYDDDDDDADVNVSGWKRIFLLPYEPVWMFTMVAIAFTRIYLSIFEAGFRILNANSNDFINVLIDIKYFTDVAYFLNIVLSFGSYPVLNFNINTILIRIPLWVSVFDLMSLIPMEMLVQFQEPLSVFQARLYYMVQLWQLFKLVRVIYLLYSYNNSIDRKDDFYYIEFLAFFFFMLLLGASLTRLIDCEVADCPKNISSNILLHYFIISAYKLTGRGSTNYPNNVTWMVTFNVLNYLFYMFGICLIISLIATKLLVVYDSVYMFLSTVEVMKKHLESYLVSKTVAANCINYYKKFWQNRKAPDIQDIQLQLLTLPAVLAQELSLDINWVVFMHSRMFRNMDLPFLRHLSQYFKSLYLLPGEILYNKGQVKHYMVYVQSGIVQISSEEDGVTPVLAFSAGTCFGEISLIFNQKPNTNVYCKSYCIIKVLYRMDFIRACTRFPQQHRQILKSFIKRIEKSKYYIKRSKKHFSRLHKKEEVTLQWLKSTLHNLMFTSEHKSSKYLYQNIFLRKDFNKDRFTNNLFCLDNLVMLAISERLELVTETVLLKSNCPCIFQPISLLTEIWKMLVLVVAVFISITMPYYAFVESHTPSWYQACMYVVTMIWWFDIYIQISTTIKTGDEFVTTIKGIFLYRIGTKGFLADIFAAMPLEIFSSIFLINVSDQTRVLMQLNRIIKLWQVIIFMKTLENNQHEYRLCFRYVNYFCIFAYGAFLGSCFLYMINCFNGFCSYQIVDNDVLIQMTWNVMAAAQIICGTGIMGVSDTLSLYSTIRTVIICVSLPFYLYSFGSLSAVYTLRNPTQTYYIEQCASILNLTNAFNVKEVYTKRLNNYLSTQWKFQHRIKTKHYDTVFLKIPQYIYQTVKRDMYAKTFENIEFLRGLPEDFLIEASMAVNGIIYPSNEVLCYAGEFSHEFYIIERGFCKAISTVEGISDHLLYPSEGVLLIEAFTELPAVHTVVTVTDCRLLSINKNKFLQIYNKHILYKGEIQKALTAINAHSRMSMLTVKDYTFESYTHEVQDNIPSIYKFGYNIQIDSFEEYDYFNPFDRAHVFWWLRFFLLRYTIIPEGKFFFAWELIRCLCAFASAILYSIVHFSTCSDCIWYYILKILDLMAWLDIYLRLHVCYYNSYRVHVRHPLKTAENYIKHSFVIDFFGVLPIHNVLGFVTQRENLACKLFRLNRVLQIHRIFGFINYLDETFTFQSPIKIAVFHIPVVAAFIFACASAINSWMCEFDKNVIHNGSNALFENGVICNEKFFIYAPHFKLPLSAIRVEMYTVYVIASIITTNGGAGFLIQTLLGAVIVIYLSVISYYIILHITSTLVAHYTALTSATSLQQNNINSISQFMTEHEVNSQLYKRVLSYYRLTWKRKRCPNTHALLEKFNNTLMKDVLFAMYGKVLRETSVFGSDSSVFIRDLLVHVSHCVLCDESLIALVNDVCSHLYIIYRGSALVIAADGTIIATLTQGSAFGNLGNFKWSRQTVSVKALGNIEILTIDSIQFHKILHDHLDVYRKFKSMTAFHCDFLKGREISRTASETIYSATCNNILEFFCKLFKYSEAPVKIWNFVIITLVCYVEVCVDIYQFALREFSTYVIVFQYFCDFLYIINYCIRRLNRSLKENTNNTFNENALPRKHTAFFYLEIFSLVPLDPISWFFSGDAFQICYCLLRLNRLLRLFILVEFFLKRERTLETNKYLNKIFSLVAWSIFLLHLSTCSLITLACTHTPNMNPELVCNRNDMTPTDRFIVYFTYSHAIVGDFARTPNSMFYPNSTQVIVFCIVLMIIMKIVSILFLVQIYSIVLLMYSKRNSLTICFDKIKHYMYSEYVSSALFIKIDNFFKFQSTQANGIIFPTFFEEAPTLLREMVLNCAFAYHLNNNFVFNKCHVDFKRQVVGYFRNCVLYENDYIVYNGTLNETMYFIHEGTIAVISEEFHIKEYVVKKLRAGSSFGIAQGVLQNLPHSYSYRCVTRTVILTLQRSTWKHLMDFFPASQIEIYTRLENYVEKYD